MPGIFAIASGHRAAQTDKASPSLDQLALAHDSRAAEPSTLIGLTLFARHSDGLSGGGGGAEDADRAYLAQFSPKQRGLIKLLRESKKPEQRLNAALALFWQLPLSFSDPKAVLLLPEFLRGLQRDPSDQVRTFMVQWMNTPLAILLVYDKTYGVDKRQTLPVAPSLWGEIVPSLCELLKDSDQRRMRVLEMMGQQASDGASFEAVRRSYLDILRLRGATLGILRNIARTFRDLIQDPAGLREQLQQIGHDESECPTTREEAAEAYGAFSDLPAVLATILELAKSRIWGDRLFAARALGERLGAKLIPEEIDATSDPEFEQIRDVLLRLLEDEEGAVRAAAVSSLRWYLLDSKEIVAKLAYDSDPNVREGLCQVIDVQGGVEEVTPLIFLLCDPVPDIQEVAKRKLGEILRESADGLFDSDPAARMEAVINLDKVFSQSWGAIQDADVAASFNLRGQDHLNRALDLEKLSSISDPEEKKQHVLQQEVRMYLGDGDFNQRNDHFDRCHDTWRAMVSSVLASRGLEATLDLLKHDNLYFRCAAIESLASMPGSEIAIPTILPLLFSGQEELVWEALQFLEKKGPAAKDAVPAIVSLLNIGDSRPDIDDSLLDLRDSHTRGLAARALKAIDDTSAIEPLRKQLEVEQDLLVQMEIRVALERLEGKAS